MRDAPLPLIPDEVSPPPRKVRTRAWARILWLLLLLVLVAVWGAWYAQQRLLAYGCENLASLLRQPLQCHNVSGTLPGAISVDLLRWSSPTMVIELRQLRVNPALSWLMAGRVSFSEASARELNIIMLSHSTEPVHLPDSMALPIPVDVTRAEVKRLRYVGSDGHALEFHNLRTRARLDRLLWTVEDARGEYQGLHMNGRASMNTRRPYALGGAVDLERQWGSRRLQARLRADGELDNTVALQAIGTLGRSPARLQAQLTLTQAHILPSASARVENWPLHEWIPGLPVLNADVEATALSDAAGWGGFIQVDNRSAGSLDRQRIPALNASSNWHWSGRDHMLLLDDLQLRMPGGGRLAGRLLWDGQLDIDAQGRDVDVRQFWSSLHPTRLSGPFTVKTDDYQRYRVSGDLRQADDRLQLRGSVDRRSAQADTLIWQRGSATVQGRGEARFDDRRRFSAELQLRQVNPAAFGHYPTGLIQGRIAANGTLSPHLQLQVDADVCNSRLFGAPLLLTGRAEYRRDHVQLHQVQVRLDGLQADLDGELGGSGRLQIQAALKGQQAWWPQLAASSASLRGVASGPLRSPGFRGAAHAEQLRYDGVQADSLQVELDAAPGLLDAVARRSLPHTQLQFTASGVRAGPLSLGTARGSATLGPAGTILHVAGQLRDARYGEQAADDITVQLDGPLSAHQLTLSLERPRQKIRLEGRGALNLHQLSWQGQLQDLQASGRLPLRLLAPAQVSVDSRSVLLGQVRLRSGKGSRFEIDHLRWQQGNWSSAGRFARLPLREFITLLGRQPPQLDLVLGGDWNVQYDGVLNGTARIERESGDIQPLEDIKGIGLNRGLLTVDVKNNHLHAELDIKSQTIGSIQGQLDSELIERDGQLGLAGQTPVSGKVRLDIPSLTWLGQWFSTPGYQFGGTLNGQVDIDGTVAAPLFNGFLHGRALSARVAEYGLDWNRGEIDATVESDRVVVDRLSIRSSTGQLQGRGLLSLRKTDPDISVELQAQRMTVFGRPDQKLVISGTGKAHLINQHLAIQSDMRVDNGLLMLKSAGDGVLDDDIVRPRRAGSQSEPRRIGLYINAKVDLGTEFKVRHKSFNAEATGVLRLESSPQRPATLTGNVGVDKGQLYAYGQKLQLEPGSSLNFNGPPDNPAFNLKAFRDNLPLNSKTGESPRVGVNVIGTARRPVLKLISTPEMTDREKLSLLVFGQDLNESRGNNTQLSVLSTAATALYSEFDDGSGNFINDTVGLDEVSVEQNTADVSKGIVRLGKQLIPNLYVSYGKGYNGAADELQLNYLFNQKWSMEIKSSETSSVDVFYTISFD